MLFLIINSRSCYIFYQAFHYLSFPSRPLKPSILFSSQRFDPSQMLAREITAQVLLYFILCKVSLSPKATQGMDDNKGNSMTDCYSFQLITTQYRWITCLPVTTVLVAWGNFIFPMTSKRPKFRIEMHATTKGKAEPVTS